METIAQLGVGGVLALAMIRMVLMFLTSRESDKIRALERKLQAQEVANAIQQDRIDSVREDIRFLRDAFAKHEVVCPGHFRTEGTKRG